jgi:hypothetical protein
VGELYKENKKQKIQATMRFRRDSLLSEKKKDKSSAKLFEVVKC